MGSESGKANVRAACFSVATYDFFPQQKQYFAGGNALNQAVRFRELGLESCFVGALGTDDAGDQVQHLLEASRVDISHLRRLPGATATNQLINDEHGERFGVDGAWAGGVYNDFLMDEADWKFVLGCDLWSTHADGPHYEPALKRKSVRNFLAVDFMHFDTYERLERGLSAVDIGYFGGEERQLGGLVALSKRFSGILVLTLGAQGSVAIKNGTTIFQAALAVDKVVDTTGCGDAFQASFTASYYRTRHRTRNIKDALLAGAEAGRKASQAYGGTPPVDSQKSE